MKKTLFILAVILLGYVSWSALYQPANKNGSDVIFVVEKGEGVTKIISDLVNKKVIAHGLPLKAYLFLTGDQTKILPGSHIVSSRMNVPQIVTVLKSPVSNERVITIIPGQNLKEVGAYLEKQGLSTSVDFMAAADISKWRDKYDFLKGVKNTTVEGFLFPDTYRVFANASAIDIIRKMLDNFDAKLRSIDVDPTSNIYSTIILASIIEKEVGRPGGDNSSEVQREREIVAGIFQNRLTSGVALQSDATVNYITGSGKARSQADDLAIDSPYNTYKYKGLPPGPIANPGLGALKAAFYPQKTNYFYFISDPATGKAIFSKTFEEHKINVQKYLE